MSVMEEYEALVGMVLRLKADAERERKEAARLRDGLERIGAGRIGRQFVREFARCWLLASEGGDEAEELILAAIIEEIAARREQVLTQAGVEEAARIARDTISTL